MHVRRHWEERTATLDDAALDDALDAQIRAAQDHGFETEFDILRFLNLVYALGPDFGTRLDWAAQILANLETPARLRMDDLTERAIALEAQEPSA